MLRLLRATITAAAVLLAGLAAGCGPRAVLFVDVSGSVNEAFGPIEALRVTVHHVRLNADRVLTYPAVGPSVELPDSLVVRLFGDVRDGEEMELTVVAVASGVDVGTGATTVNVARGAVTNTEVVLQPIVTPPGCGDGVLDDGEECDGGDLGGADCASASGGTLTTGMLACDTSCAYDVAGCSQCGNGIAEIAEACDGADLAGADCTTAGLAAGTLACAAACDAFDTTACYDAPSVPVLRKPMNDSYLGSIFIPGSLRPLFTWEPSSSAGGPAISYELQYGDDPTLAAGAVTVPTSMTSFQPTSDLAVSLTEPVGNRMYWRVRACAGTACSAYSTAWWINVGRGAHDLNGDGFDDIIVGAPYNDANGTDAGRGYVYFGNSGVSMDIAADATLGGTAAFDLFGQSVAIVGDVNGDAFSDLAVGAPSNDAGGNEAGRVYIFFGAPGTTFDSVADVTLTGAVGDNFGTAIAGGDINGDGFSDVLIGSPNHAAGPVPVGQVSVFLGAPAGPSATPALVVTGTEDTAAFGAAVAIAGDLNGDGFADLAVAAPSSASAGTGSGEVQVLFGGTILDGTADGTLAGGGVGYLFGVTLAGASDLNDDGFGDLVVGAPGNNAAYVYLGGSGSPFEPVADAELVGPAGSDFGRWVAGIGDVSGDGFADLAVGAPFADIGSSNTGRLYAYFGGPGSAFDPTAEGTPTGATGDHLGTAVEGAGDVNGDGFCDVVAGSVTGYVDLYLGAPLTSLDTVPDTTFAGSGPDGFGTIL